MWCTSKQLDTHRSLLKQLYLGVSLEWSVARISIRDTRLDTRAFIPISAYIRELPPTKTHCTHRCCGDALLYAEPCPPNAGGQTRRPSLTGCSGALLLSTEPCPSKAGGQTVRPPLTGRGVGFSLLWVVENSTFRHLCLLGCGWSNGGRRLYSVS